MKLKVPFLLLLLSLVFISCNKDDDPTYEWRTLWLDQTLDANGTVLRTDTVFDGVQRMSDEDAKVIVRGPAACFMISDVNNDDIQTEGDVKTRTILHSNKSRKLIYSNTKVK